MTGEDIYSFYRDVKAEVRRQGYGWEIDHVDGLRFEDTTADKFFAAYVFVVLSSGMKNQVAESVFRKYVHAGCNAEVIGHPGKREAIRQMLRDYPKWFDGLKDAPDKVEYLSQMPWIGPITKYHLARNIGLDVAKPDRHLVRMAARFGFSDVQSMCKSIAERTGDRIGVVDVVLWRFSNLMGT